MNKLVLLTAALVATLATGALTLPSSAQTPKEEIAPGDYAGQSTRFNVAAKYCKGLSTMTPAGRDAAAKKFEALKEKEFQEQAWDCYDPSWRVNGKRVVKNDDDNNDTPKPVSYRQSAPAYRSFDNVAAGSHHVRSRGKDYNLRNIGGNTRSCNPPMQLVRSERCGPTPNGRGVRCQFDCR